MPGKAGPWEGKIMSVELVVSFFNQINHDLTENNFCLLMASPAFEVPQGTVGFEVWEGRSSRCARLYMCVD